MNLQKAIILSLIAHVVLIALLAFNYQFSKVDVKQSKNPRQINATSVNAQNVRDHLNKIKQKDINKKNKEIERLREIKRKEELKKKKKIDEENKAKKEKQRRADVERKKKQDKKKADEAKKKKIADEKARKKKIAADKKLAAKKKADQEKKNKAEAERKRKKKEEAARQKKLAEEKAAQEALEREMELQMADEAAALNNAKQQQILTEVDKFNLLISNKIKRNWIEPEQKGSCQFRITMAPGGLITSITVLKGDSLHCDTGRRAINKSEPLPVSKDPDIFAVLKTRTFELENLNDKEEYDN